MYQILYIMCSELDIRWTLTRSNTSLAQESSTYTHSSHSTQNPFHSQSQKTIATHLYSSHSLAQKLKKLSISFIFTIINHSQSHLLLSLVFTQKPCLHLKIIIMLGKFGKQVIKLLSQDAPQSSEGYEMLEELGEGTDFFSRKLTKNVGHKRLRAESKHSETT